MKDKVANVIKIGDHGTTFGSVLPLHLLPSDQRSTGVDPSKRESRTTFSPVLPLPTFFPRFNPSPSLCNPDWPFYPRCFPHFFRALLEVVV